MARRLVFITDYDGTAEFFNLYTEEGPHRNNLALSKAFATLSKSARYTGTPDLYTCSSRQTPALDQYIGSKQKNGYAFSVIEHACNTHQLNFQKLLLPDILYGVPAGSTITDWDKEFYPKKTMIKSELNKIGLNSVDYKHYSDAAKQTVMIVFHQVLDAITRYADDEIDFAIFNDSLEVHLALQKYLMDNSIRLRKANFLFYQSTYYGNIVFKLLNQITSIEFEQEIIKQFKRNYPQALPNVSMQSINLKDIWRYCLHEAHQDAKQALNTAYLSQGICLEV